MHKLVLNIYIKTVVVFSNILLSKSKFSVMIRTSSTQYPNIPLDRIFVRFM